MTAMTTDDGVASAPGRRGKRAMVLEAVGAPLRLAWLDPPAPGPGDIEVRVEACGVCRTDLHVVDGELPEVRPPVIPGHEVVGRVVALGAGVDAFHIGDRVGIPWLGGTCRVCEFCREGKENLCDAPEFTGYTRPGGFASHVVAHAAYCVPLPPDRDAVALAPLLCAGLIGWRSLRRAGSARCLGLYGFGAAAHLVAQMALAEGRTVYAFTREGDVAAQDFARSLGVSWAGSSLGDAPAPLDAAIIFAPDGGLVVRALRQVKKGGRVVCAGIHMSDIPAFPYRWLWEEREIVSVANLTRDDATSFFGSPHSAGLRASTRTYKLEEANQALDDLRHGRLSGAAVLVP